MAFSYVVHDGLARYQAVFIPKSFPRGSTPYAGSLYFVRPNARRLAAEHLR